MNHFCGNLKKMILTKALETICKKKTFQALIEIIVGPFELTWRRKQWKNQANFLEKLVEVSEKLR